MLTRIIYSESCNGAHAHNCEILSLNKVGDAQSRKLKEDKSKAEDIRQKALERYSETKKLKSTENGDECEEKPKCGRRSARTDSLVEFMQEKAKTERELRHQQPATRARSKKTRATTESASDGDCLAATTANKSSYSVSYSKAY